MKGSAAEPKGNALPFSLGTRRLPPRDEYWRTHRRLRQHGGSSGVSSSRGAPYKSSASRSTSNSSSGAVSTSYLYGYRYLQEREGGLIDLDRNASIERMEEENSRGRSRIEVSQDPSLAGTALPRCLALRDDGRWGSASRREVCLQQQQQQRYANEWHSIGGDPVERSLSSLPSSIGSPPTTRGRGGGQGAACHADPSSSYAALCLSPRITTATVATPTPHEPDGEGDGKAARATRGVEVGGQRDTAQHLDVLSTSLSLVSALPEDLALSSAVPLLIHRRRRGASPSLARPSSDSEPEEERDHAGRRRGPQGVGRASTFSGNSTSFGEDSFLKSYSGGSSGGGGGGSSGVFRGLLSSSPSSHRKLRVRKAPAVSPARREGRGGAVIGGSRVSPCFSPSTSTTVSPLAAARLGAALGAVSPAHVRRLRNAGRHPSSLRGRRSKVFEPVAHPLEGPEWHPLTLLRDNDDNDNGRATAAPAQPFLRSLIPPSFHQSSSGGGPGMDTAGVERTAEEEEGGDCDSEDSSSLSLYEATEDEPQVDTDALLRERLLFSETADGEALLANALGALPPPSPCPPALRPSSPVGDRRSRLGVDAVRMSGGREAEEGGGEGALTPCPPRWKEHPRTDESFPDSPSLSSTFPSPPAFSRPTVARRGSGTPPPVTADADADAYGVGHPIRELHFGNGDECSVSPSPGRDASPPVREHSLAPAELLYRAQPNN